MESMDGELTSYWITDESDQCSLTSDANAISSGDAARDHWCRPSESGVESYLNKSSNDQYEKSHLTAPIMNRAAKMNLNYPKKSLNEWELHEKLHRIGDSINYSSTDNYPSIIGIEIQKATDQANKARKDLKRLEEEKAELSKEREMIKRDKFIIMDYRKQIKEMRIENDKDAETIKAEKLKIEEERKAIIEKEKELQLLERNLQHQKLEIEKTRENIDETKRELANEARSLQEEKHKLDNEVLTLEIKAKNVETESKTLNEILKQIESKEQEIMELKREIEESKTQFKKSVDETQSLRRELQNYDKRFEEYKIEVEIKAKETLERLKMEYLEEKTMLERALEEKRREIEEIKKNTINLQTYIDDLLRKGRETQQSCKNRERKLLEIYRENEVEERKARNETPKLLSKVKETEKSLAKCRPCADKGNNIKQSLHKKERCATVEGECIRQIGEENVKRAQNNAIQSTNAKVNKEKEQELIPICWTCAARDYTTAINHNNYEPHLRNILQQIKVPISGGKSKDKGKTDITTYASNYANELKTFQKGSSDQNFLFQLSDFVCELNELQLQITNSFNYDPLASGENKLIRPPTYTKTESSDMIRPTENHPKQCENQNAITGKTDKLNEKFLKALVEEYKKIIAREPKVKKQKKVWQKKYFSDASDFEKDVNTCKPQRLKYPCKRKGVVENTLEIQLDKSHNKVNSTHKNCQESCTNHEGYKSESAEATSHRTEDEDRSRSCLETFRKTPKKLGLKMLNTARSKSQDNVVTIKPAPPPPRRQKLGYPCRRLNKTFYICRTFSGVIETSHYKQFAKTRGDYADRCGKGKLNDMCGIHSLSKNVNNKLILQKQEKELPAASVESDELSDKDKKREVVDVKWAVLKINQFSDESKTYEVMKTSDKPLTENVNPKAVFIKLN